MRKKVKFVNFKETVNFGFMHNLPHNVIASQCAHWRGNLQPGSKIPEIPINMVYPEFTMLIGFLGIIPLCWRLPRRFAPRNDIVG